jgi:hypothetical protein
MLTLTAQAATAIQCPVQICEPFFGVNRKYELPRMQMLPDIRHEALIRTPSFRSPRWSASPVDCSLGETLDWDFVADPDPERILGTISVTLKYVDLSVSAHVEGTLD